MQDKTEQQTQTKDTSDKDILERVRIILGKEWVWMEILIFIPAIISIILFGILPAYLFFLFLLDDFIESRKSYEPSALKLLFFN